MTRDEARADNNLPPLPDGQGEMIITPLNVVEGGQASPQDTHMEEQEPMALQDTHEASCSCIQCKSKNEPVRIKAKSTQEEDERMAEVLSKFWKRQADSILPKLGAKSAKWWDEDRWNDELTEDLTPVINDVADAHGKETADAIGFEYDTSRTRKYLGTLAAGRAKAINESTRKKLQAAIDDEDEENTPAHVFEVRQNKDTTTFGRMLALTVAGWAAVREAPQQAESFGIEKTMEKVWVTGTNPRPEHEAMNNQRVPIDEPFSNGCYWPGDENGDPDTTCGCNCSTEIIISF